MPQMIQNGRELIRINPTTKAIEWSTNDGRTWHVRFRVNSLSGNFISLFLDGNELLATAEKGLLWSTNEGRSWHVRYRTSFYVGEFQELYLMVASC